MPFSSLPFCVVILLSLCIHEGFTKNNPPILLNFQSSKVIVKPEDTPINTTIGMLSARDSDGPMPIIFSITDSATESLVTLSDPMGDSATNTSVNIILIQSLDRDREPSERKLYFNVADGDQNVDHNNIPVQVTLFIQDVNDEVPEFVSLRYKQSIPEDEPIGTTITTVKAIDPDNGLGGTVTYSMHPVAQAADEDFRNAFRIDPYYGHIIINGTLDYENHNIYEFTIKAEDGYGQECKTPADLVVKILDVQDTKPYFINLPYSETVPEDKPVGEAILQVTALDGDRGIPNKIKYNFESGEHDNFDIDSTTGWIRISKTLDRESADVQQTGGVYAMYVTASEIINNSSNYGETNTTTLVTIRVQDVNDNAPEFNNKTYRATIMENMDNDVPISLTDPNAIMSVSDRDQESNSHFNLTVMKDGLPYYDFAPVPRKIYSGSSFQIKVNNSDNLDFEKMTNVTFQIVATETSTPEHFSSTATVILMIRDSNDNQPEFNQTVYTAYMAENSHPGSSVIALHATDKDAGEYGEITYSLRGGNGRFIIDNRTGLVMSDAELDREKVAEYYLTGEAKDGGGFRSTVELHVIVTDKNDNAPVFLRDEYFSTVKEGSSTFLRGPLRVQARDEDDPTTNNSIVQYRIISTPPGLQHNFTVNSQTGVITLLAPLNYEELNPSLNGKIPLEVEAYDLGTPVQRSAINVTIEVEDENDNTPKFNQSYYSASVPENATDDYVVLKVTATDMDGTSPNNEFIYRIDSGALDKFRINLRTGEISVEYGARLDREERFNYTLNVSATDKGAKALTGNCTVNIIVTDINDEEPYFIPESKSEDINEHAAPGTVVCNYTAQDHDLNHNLFYNIINGSVSAKDELGKSVDIFSNNIQNYFDISPTTGVVLVKSSLDRETAEEVVLEILVTDLNAWKPPVQEQTATATLTITILDFNDNTPVFSPTDVYKVNISEGREVGDVVLPVSATDQDKNQGIRYRIGTDVTNSFAIDKPDTGIVTLKKELNREAADTVQFTVIAEDTGSLPLSSTATVILTVTDINDNAPVFLPHNSQYMVAENAAIGTRIATINATDSDIGAFGKIFYSLQVTDNDGSLAVNNETGVLYVKKKLDFEAKKTYTIRIIATDNIGDDENQKAQQTQPITIHVLDVNDNAPVILNNGTIPTNIYEYEVKGSSLLTVTAFDPDNGVNGTIDYELVPQQTNATGGWFSIDTVFNSDKGANEGLLKCDVDLLGKVGIYYITVKATDRGTPFHLSSNKSLLLNIVDVNENPPEFVRPKGPRATLQILEQQPPGTKVIDIFATDADYGLNAEVHYYLSPENDYQKFRLNKDNGTLTTSEVLDREVQSTYEIKVIANDSGLINVMDTSITIFINLIDIDDQDPEFPRGPGFEPYILNPVAEEQDFAYVGNVNITIDKDSDLNNTLTFYFLTGGAMRDHFYLNQTGELYLTKSIDRDGDKNPSKQPINFVDLVIWATPYSYFNMQSTSRRKRSVSSLPAPPVYNPSNRTLLWARVPIQDVNDHPAKFDNKFLSIGITRKTQFGEIIYNLKDEVTDADIGMNSNHSFHLNYITVHPDSLSQSLGGSKTFQVFPNGTVKTETYFQSDMNGYFVLNISVLDVDGKLDSAILRISLINDDQRVKVIFRMSPEQVKNISADFRRKLEMITGYNISVDKIQTHENSEGKPEVDKTDMFIHAEKMNPFQIVDAAELLSKIDSRAAELVKVLNDYNILEIVSTDVQVEEDDSVRKLTMGLILVAILLGIPCIVMIIVIYLTIKSYQRKLKAATAMAYAPRNSGKDSDMQKLQIPGTNIHSYENANPIFLEKILLEESGDIGDDDSIDNNAVDPSQVKPYEVQTSSMNFNRENERENHYGSPDMNLKAAIKAHDSLSAKRNGTSSFKSPSSSKTNGHLDQNGGPGNRSSEYTLQTTEI